MVGDAVSREETNFPGSPEQPPAAAVDVIRGVVGDVTLQPVAQLVTDRHTVDLVVGDTRRAEVADDRVAIRSGDTTVQPFERSRWSLRRRRSPDRRGDVATPSIRRRRTDSTPKYVRALRALGHEIPEQPRS